MAPKFPWDLIKNKYNHLWLILKFNKTLHLKMNLAIILQR